MEPRRESLFVGYLVAERTMYQQGASESQGRICLDSCTCCHTETEAKYQTHPATAYWNGASQSQRWPYNARRLAGWQQEYRSLSHWYESTRKKPLWESRDRTQVCRSLGGYLITRPARQPWKKNAGEVNNGRKSWTVSATDKNMEETPSDDPWTLCVMTRWLIGLLEVSFSAFLKGTK